MATPVLEIGQLAQQFQAGEPQEILRYSLESCEKIAIAFSGAQDVTLIDMAVRIDPAVRVFALDTLRLHPEPYRFLERVRQHCPLANWSSARRCRSRPRPCPSAAGCWPAHSSPIGQRTGLLGARPYSPWLPV